MISMNWYKKASVERLFHWTCNVCGKEETKQGYGLPSGWEWYGNKVDNPEVKHKCPDCVNGKSQSLTTEELLLKEVNKK